MRQLAANASGLQTLRLDVAHADAMAAPASVLQWRTAGVVCMAGRVPDRALLTAWNVAAGPTGVMGITRRRPDRHARKPD
jgi:hypothetical protein